MNSGTSAYVVVLSTCPAREEAEALAMRLLSDKAAACVNIIDRVTSIYQWQGRIEKSGEVLLIIKTRRDLASRVTGTIKGFSSYDCPEAIVLPIIEGTPEYLGWITDVTAKT